MKKIFTLLSAALMSLTVSAESYTCALAVDVFGKPTQNGTKIELTCNKNDNGKYDVQLKDFYFGEQPVGDINVKDINAEEEDGDIYLTFDGNITLSGAYAMLGALPTTLEGLISGGEIGIRLQIPLVGVNVIVHSPKTQIYGADFENWHETRIEREEEYDPLIGSEPNGWHNITSGTGAFAAIGVLFGGDKSASASDDVREGATGKTSAKIQSSAPLGISANGTITTGRMNVGAMTATDPQNNVYIDPKSEDKDANGDPFYSTIGSHPTSISLWYKFKNGEGNDKPALVSTFLVGNGNYFQDPIVGDDKNYIASAKQDLPATDEWTQITIPFDYNTDMHNEEYPYYILTTINTCNVPAGGSGSADNPDVLYVDDVTLNYEPVITGIEIFEKPVEGFSADKKDYKIVLGDEIPTDDDIDIYCATGEAIAMTYYEAKTKKLTVNVYNEELKFIDSYVFDTDPAGINGVTTDSNHAVTGRYTVSGQKAGKNTRGLVITKYADGTVVKSFK